ncbi:type II toxin-antitoxin system RelB family antitoxin [Plantibacter sp. RU18]|uniref:type II toxin-antitoxin system RelB family antitoxin n=1 Tax=Plantibacter sp. RU18 TaxID=3158143 RepID=UPI003D35F630
MTVAVRLSPELESRLGALAECTGRTRSFYVKEAITLHLEELEEHYWADAAITPWEASPQETRPWAEAKEGLGL